MGLILGDALASVFSSYGGYESGTTFADGLNPGRLGRRRGRGPQRARRAPVPRSRAPAEAGAGELVPATASEPAA